MVYPEEVKIFAGEKWDKATFKERMAALQSVEKFLAKQSGREPRTVTAKVNYPQLGGFNQTKPELIINQELVREGISRRGDNYNALATVIHEGRHSFQHDAVTGKIPTSESQLSKWEKNFYPGVYTESKQGLADHHFQPIESDAREYTNNTLKQFETAFADDKSYQNYKSVEKLKDEEATRMARNEYGHNFQAGLDEAFEKKYLREAEKKGQMKSPNNDPDRGNDQSYKTVERATVQQDSMKKSLRIPVNSAGERLGRTERIAIDKKAPSEQKTARIQRPVQKGQTDQKNPKESYEKKRENGRGR